MNAVKIPAASSRYDGWKIDTGVSSSLSAAPWPTEKSRTASSTMLETTMRSAESRSTYSTMPNGIGQSPTETARASPPWSTTTRRIAAMTVTVVSVTIEMATWVRR